MTNTLKSQLTPTSASEARYMFLSGSLAFLQEAMDQTSLVSDVMQHAIEADLSEEKKAFYLREYRTIGAHPHRQVGKTRWIVENSDKHTLIVVENLRAAAEMKAKLVERGPRGHILATIMTLKDLKKLEDGELPIMHTFRKVMVDDASYLFDKISRKSFYKAICPITTKNTTVYMIG